MRAVSAAARAALATSHVAPVTVTATLAGREVPLIVEDGLVTEERSRLVRRVLSLKVLLPHGSDVSPADPTSVFSPFAGAIIFVQRGVTTSIIGYDGDMFGVESVENIPLGVFVVVESSVSDGPAGVTVDLACEDTSTVLTRDWQTEWTVASGTPVDEAIMAILSSRGVDSSAMDITIPGFTTPNLILGAGSGGSPLLSCVELARMAGYDLHTDRLGVFRARQFSSPYDTPVADVSNAILSVERSVDATSVRNGVILQAEGTGMLEPIRAERWITDPTSPLRRDGPFGENAAIVSSAMVKNQEQAEAAVESLFGDVVGFEFGAECLPLPHHEAGDVIAVAASNINTTGVVESVTVPLAKGRTRLTMRGVEL